jgi:hypothetical protein
MMTVAHRLALGLPVLLLLHAPLRAACPLTIDQIAYRARGGLLISENYIHWGKLPAGFFCDRVACFGEVRLSGLIDENGKIENLVVTGNTWPVRPAEHAAAIRARALEIHYSPPRVDGHPVCVRMKWNYAFGPDQKAP